MSERDGNMQAHRMLQTIARTLDVPLETFFSSREDDAGVSSEAQEAEMLDLFHRIRDPQDRQRYLNLLREMGSPP